MKKIALSVVALLFVPCVASAVVTFDHMGDNVFVVSHLVKWYGGRGQAMRVVTEKAASLCIAAGYSHMVLLGEASSAGGEYEIANAQVRVAFRSEGGDEELIACQPLASQKYIDQAKAELQRVGYAGPVEPKMPEGVGGSACTIDQVMAMTKAGFTEDQIKAACPG